MHFGIVFATSSQDVNNLSDGILRSFGPFNDSHHCLVAALSALQQVGRDKDVVGQRATFGQQEGIPLAHLQCAHKRVLGTFDDFDYLALWFVSASFGMESHAHLIAAHGMSRVAFGNQDRFAPLFGSKGVLSVVCTLESAHHLHAMRVQAILMIINLHL